MDQAV